MATRATPSAGLASLRSQTSRLEQPSVIADVQRPKMSILDNPVALVVCVTAFVGGALLIGSGAFQIWLTSLLAKAPVSLVTIIGMRMRDVKASDIVMAYILCRKVELPVTIQELEALYLASPKQFLPEVHKLVNQYVKGQGQSPNPSPERDTGTRPPSGG
jgi:hypothetical protein